MLRNIVLVSHNKGKIKEVKEILEPHNFNVLSLQDINYQDDIEETGTTFEENALIKARALKDDYDFIIADDSGLEIKALDNKPGVMSARWLGEETDYVVKNQKVIELLADCEDRRARFVSVIALIMNGKEYLFRGELDGEISEISDGSGGFGYDPIFYVPSRSQTLGSMSSEEKNMISHRAAALKKLEAFLDEEN